MRILSSSQRIRIEEFGLFFDDGNGCGACFDCDKAGSVDVSKMAPAARANYEERLAKGQRGYVQDFSRHFWQAAVGECACGAHVALQGFTNSCGCGRDYNSAGQLLAPRACWGEETGEHPADIARIP